MPNVTTGLSEPMLHREARELVPTDSLLSQYVSVDPGRMHGEPCFKGTRVPVQTLFDHLRSGDSLAAFLEGFPDVSREDAVAIIDLSAMGLLEGLRHLLKLILDNCVHYQAKALFKGHEALHARDVGWRHLLNGALIAQAATRFDVLVTTDEKIRHEQNLDKLPISVLELNTRFTRIEDLRTLAPFLDDALAACLEYRFVSVTPDGLLEKLGKFPKD